MIVQNSVCQCNKQYFLVYKMICAIWCQMRRLSCCVIVIDVYSRWPSPNELHNVGRVASWLCDELAVWWLDRVTSWLVFRQIIGDLSNCCLISAGTLCLHMAGQVSRDARELCAKKTYKLFLSTSFYPIASYLFVSYYRVATVPSRQHQNWRRYSTINAACESGLNTCSKPHLPSAGVAHTDSVAGSHAVDRGSNPVCTIFFVFFSL